ncbi:MAG: VWA domain-containing protein [Acidobacteriota bacterium]|nr:VWA domain-containing protein [Acidobacteriota bacterium]
MNKQNTKIELFTEKSKLTAGKQQTINLLVRINPPEVEQNESKRPKLNLSIVLDRSGSMEGNKMRQAREAAKYCVENLLPTDRLSTVIFDDVVEILFPSQPVENKERLKKQIDSIHSRNSTALHEAWVRGGLEVSNQLDSDAINRVLLITDGQANVGETNADRIVSQSQQLAARGVSTSTVGIGDDFNEDLLMPMAEAGGGNAWHVEQTEDMMRIFAVELEGLIAQVGHSVTVGIKPKSGATVADILNDFERDEAGRYKLPNLQAGAPLDVVIQLRVPANKTGGKITLADIDLTFTGQDSKLPEVVKSSFEIEFDSADAIEALPENLEVAKAVQLLMNARARREAIDKMDRQDFGGAQAALRKVAMSTEILFSRVASPDVRKEIDELAELEESLKHRSNDKMGRKQMMYSAYKKRQGK